MIYLSILSKELIPLNLCSFSIRLVNLGIILIESR